MGRHHHVNKITSLQGRHGQADHRSIHDDASLPQEQGKQSTQTALDGLTTAVALWCLVGLVHAGEGDSRKGCLRAQGLAVDGVGVVRHCWVGKSTVGDTKESRPVQYLVSCRLRLAGDGRRGRGADRGAVRTDKESHLGLLRGPKARLLGIASTSRIDRT